MDVICVSSFNLKIDIITVNEEAALKKMLHVESSILCL